MEQKREENGRYASGMHQWEKKGLLLLAAIALVYLSGVFIYAKFTPAEIVAAYQPIAHADTASTTKELQGLTVAQLEEKLDAIVWGGESQKNVMDDGEIFPTFDPSPSMYAQCIKIGGKQNKDCLSYGPRQEKIGTIEAYWPKLHTGTKITDKDARDIAESNENSKRFFLDCSEQIKGCADNWTTFENHKDEGQIYLDLIREAKSIVL